MSVKLITLTRPVPMSVRELSGGWLCRGGEREEGYHPGCTERSGGSLGRLGADLDRTGRQAPTSLFTKGTGILQSGRNSHKISGAVDHRKRTTPVDVGQGLGRPIN